MAERLRRVAGGTPRSFFSSFGNNARMFTPPTVPQIDSIAPGTSPGQRLEEQRRAHQGQVDQVRCARLLAEEDTMASTIHEVQAPQMLNGNTNPSASTAPAPPDGVAHRSFEFHLTRRIVEVIVIVLLAVAGSMLVAISSSATSTVNSELTAQGLRFPPTGPTFNASLFPEAAPHAGQLVNSGQLAEVYANGYLAPVILFATGGKTAGEVAALAHANPTNATLGAQATQAFEASTTKGLLLKSWGWSRLASQMLVGGIALLVAAALLLVVATLDVVTGKRMMRRPTQT